MTAVREPLDGGIVDAHHHLWVRSRHAQDWIDPHTMAATDADFEPADLAGPAEMAGVTRTVVVQSISSVAETVDLLRTATDTELIGGVVGWVDFTSPDVADRLDELRTGYGGNHETAMVWGRTARRVYGLDLP